ncbi:hypothetical protein F5Y07DRAFT_385472 [Xylaria sp. FL0933]|nr:hypothetical protein F5Y07DRAFT_385472 [Xylaria sp. FL0933]
MVTSTKPPANAFVAHAREVYNPIGVAVEYLGFWDVFCNPNEGPGQGALPGECFYYTQRTRYHVGIILHLATVVPGSLLACFQFVPVVRHKAILVHRGVDVELLFGVLAICFLGSLVIAIINIKRLQIEQHRAWMIRPWAFGGVIITLRIGLIIGAIIVSSIGGYYFAEPCDKINYALGGQDATLSFYPQCTPFFSGENLDQQAVVKANYNGNDTIEVGAAFNIVFWSRRVVGHSTSCFRRRVIQAGMNNPGRAGLTADRLGDAARWTPESAAGSDSDGGETLKEAAEVPFLSHNRS